MAYFVGDQIAEIWTVLDDDNEPVPGLEWVAETTLNPVGNSFPFTVEEIGDGGYRITWTADYAGLYYAQLVSLGEVDGDLVRIAINADVDGNTIAPNQVQGPGGITRGRLRQLIAQSLNDYQRITATKSTDMTQLVSGLDLFASDNHYRGSEILFLTGANAGFVRRVISSQSTNVQEPFLNVFPTLPFVINAGDTAEVYNIKTNGFRIQDYNDAIDFAIYKTDRASNLIHTETLDGLFDANAGTITIPEVFYNGTINDVQWWDGYQWQSIPRSQSPGLMGWYLNPGVYTITIGLQPAWNANGHTIRLVGTLPHPVMSSDSDITKINPSWLIVAAGLFLLQRRQEPRDFTMISLLQQQSMDQWAMMSFNDQIPDGVRVQ